MSHLHGQAITGLSHFPVGGLTGRLLIRIYGNVCHRNISGRQSCNLLNLLRRKHRLIDRIELFQGSRHVLSLQETLVEGLPQIQCGVHLFANLLRIFVVNLVCVRERRHCVQKRLNRLRDFRFLNGFNRRRLHRDNHFRFRYLPKKVLVPFQVFHSCSLCGNAHDLCVFAGNQRKGKFLFLRNFRRIGDVYCLPADQKLCRRRAFHHKSDRAGFFRLFGLFRLLCVGRQAVCFSGNVFLNFISGRCIWFGSVCFLGVVSFLRGVSLCRGVLRRRISFSLCRVLPVICGGIVAQRSVIL